jgi:hypothetical protein
MVEDYPKLPLRVSYGLVCRMLLSLAFSATTLAAGAKVLP